MILRNQRDFSAPHQKLVRESFEENRKSKVINSPISESKELILRFDINTLLSMFNEMDSNGNGEVSKKGIKKIMEAIGLHHQDNRLKHESYTFDSFLSILGEL
jgi:Ca2+-binding EF-hand superfamily protein